MSDIIQTLKRLKARGTLPNYIEYVKLPKFKDMEEDTQIDFNFPLTVFIGANGTRKSSVLKGIQGCPKGRSPSSHWFSTSMDPIDESGGPGNKRNSIIHAYKSGTKILECLKTRSNKKGRSWDYWETSKPRKIYGMDSTDREEPIDKHVEYLNFRSLLPAFDKCFYYSGKFGVQDYIRSKTRFLKNAILTGSVSKRGAKVQNDARVIFTPGELQHLSKILGRDYVDGAYIRHKFFDGWAETVVLSTSHYEYSEAFAGSGEIAVSVLVHKIESAPDGSLIILDEPEVSLHPEAQRRLKDYLLEKIKVNHHQIIISTHSPFMAEGLPKEAIKAFRISSATGKTEVLSDISPAEAFSVIGYTSVPDKKVIWVEDKLAQTLVEHVIATEDDTRQALFEVRIGVSDGQMYKDIAHTCDKDETKNYFYLFDGDNRPNFAGITGVVPNDRGVCTFDQIPTGQTDLDGLGLIIQRQSKNTEPAKLGLAAGSDPQTHLEKYELYLKFMEEHVCYLPFKTPEELLWSDSFAEQVLTLIGMEDAEIATSMAQINAEADFKEKFALLSKFQTSDKGTSSEILTLQKTCITKFIKEADENFEAIKVMIDYIANFDET